MTIRELWMWDYMNKPIPTTADLTICCYCGKKKRNIVRNPKNLRYGRLVIVYRLEKICKTCQKK